MESDPHKSLDDISDGLRLLKSDCWQLEGFNKKVQEGIFRF